MIIILNVVILADFISIMIRERKKKRLKPMLIISLSILKSLNEYITNESRRMELSVLQDITAGLKPT